MLRLRLLLPVLATLVLGAMTAAPAGAVVIGIGDQKPSMFSDPRFLASGMRYARLAVSWDAMRSRWQVAEVDAWMSAAKAAGVQPLVSFMHSRTNRKSLPTANGYLREFQRFQKRYPFVKDYATWNEANLCGEPTCHKPELAAAYYRKLRSACPGCNVLAAELLDSPDMTSWIRRFRKAAGVEPKYWGLHNYIDANRFQTSGTRTMLRAVKGYVWMTEVGGIVSRRNHTKFPFEESPRHAALAISWVFDKLVPLSPRIQRVYIYHWNADALGGTWDSALIGPGGRARPALAIVQRELTLEAARRAARAAARR